MVLIHALISALGGVITIVVLYLLYRKPSVCFWGWIASFLSDIPVFWLSTLGATSLGTVMFITHTAGIFLFPIALVILDIFLIEITWIKYFSWLPYPRYVRILGKIDRFAETLEKYKAIPKPIRVTRVYFVGVLAGIIHLVVNMIVGFL